MADDEKDKQAEDSARLDIWLWATRLYKTRAMAADAVKRNQVRVNGQTVKPSRQVRAGDQIEFKRGPLTRNIEVKDVLTKRVGAKLVDDFVIDHTSKEAYEQAAEISRQNRESAPKRDAGAGRPTKKDRREMEDFSDERSAFQEFAKAMKKNISLIIAVLAVTFANTENSIAQEKKDAPPRRTFEEKEGVPKLQINEKLIVFARSILPEKNPDTGKLTAMGATGDVLIKVKPGESKDWILVACDKAVYDSAADSIKLTGFPAVKSGMQILRATEAKTYVSVDRKSGKWEIKGPHKIELSIGGFKKKR